MATHAPVPPLPRGGAPPQALVRPAQPRDWPALWPLLQDMGRTDSEDAVRTRLIHLRRRAEHYFPVAVVGGAVVGYAWAQDYGPHLRSGMRTARLNDLYVGPATRRRGAGRALLQSIVTWAERRGVRWLQWQASASALPFYARLGLIGDANSDPGHPFFEIDFALKGSASPLAQIYEHLDS